jgi:small subunit ribosomal protein S16
MSLKIRLARHGTKKRPFYHIVVANSRAPRDGRFLEKLGRYNPMLPSDHAERIVINEERAKHWLSVGAQATDRVDRFLGQKGIVPKKAFTENPLKSQPKKKAQERLAAEVSRKEKAEAAAIAAKEAEKAAAEAASKEAAEAAAAPVEIEAEAESITVEASEAVTVETEAAPEPEAVGTPDNTEESTEEGKQPTE